MKGKRGALFALACCLALCALLAACGQQKPTTQQIIDQKDTWAEGVLRDAIDGLAKEGAIESVAKDAQLLTGAFEYDGTDGNYGIVYKNSQVESEITGSFSLPAGKVMLCDPDYNGDMRVFYRDGSAGKFGASSPDDAPLFYPESLYGYFSEQSMAKLLDGVDVSRFADDLDGCDYLIAFDSVFTHVDEDFYFGSISRKSCTTFVVVVDAKSKKVLHIENIGTDTPANQVKSGGEAGQMLSDELIAYLHGLLA